jgi:hypothetical protein
MLSRKRRILGRSFSVILARYVLCPELEQSHCRGEFYRTVFGAARAQNTGLDPSQLILVYRPQKRDAAVVRNNGAFVATVFQMQSTFTDINNPNNSITVRQALLSNPANENISGSFFGLEQRTLNATGQLSSDSLTGMAVYSNSDGNLVYSAHVSTGARVTDMTNAP